jgi:hypothetical protein
MKRERTKIEGNGEPVVPSHVYRVVVYLLKDGVEYCDFIDTTSAQSPLGAMRGVLDAAIAKEMLALQRDIEKPSTLALRRDIEEPGMPAFTHCLNCDDETCTLLSGCKQANEA